MHLVVLVQRTTLVTTIPIAGRVAGRGGASIYPFVHNIALALRAEGLGTTLSTVLVPVEAQVSCASPMRSRWRPTSASAAGRGPPDSAAAPAGR